MMIDPNNYETYAAIRCGQRQGILAGLMLAAGAAIVGYNARAILFRRFGVERNVEYDFSKIHK